MIKWLRNLLRRWLLEEQKELPVTTLEVYTAQGIQRLAVLGAVGTLLQVSSGKGVHLIGADSCVAPSQFWLAWRQHNPKASGATWADGTPANLGPPPAGKRGG